MLGDRQSFGANAGERGTNVSKSDEADKTEKTDKDPSKSKDESEVIGDFLQDMLRSLGRGASKARDFIAGLGEKGATALSLHKLETEKRRLLLDLGDLTRRTLAAGDVIDADHQHANDLVKSLARIEEKIEKYKSKEPTSSSDAGAKTESTGDE